jgi:hypothetical protein
MFLFWKQIWFRRETPSLTIQALVMCQQSSHGGTEMEHNNDTWPHPKHKKEEWIQ